MDDLVQNILLDNGTVVIVKIVNDFIIIVTDTGDDIGFILIRIFLIWRKGNISR